MPGTFVFRPLEANINQKDELLAKIHPYCSISLGGKKFESNASVNKDGKHPIWKDVIDIPITNESSLQLSIIDKYKSTADECLGTATIDLKNIRDTAPSQNWFPLLYKNKPAGEILLETSYEDADFQRSKKEGYLKSGAQSSDINMSSKQKVGYSSGQAQQDIGFSGSGQNFDQRKNKFGYGSGQAQQNLGFNSNMQGQQDFNLSGGSLGQQNLGLESGGRNLEQQTNKRIYTEQREVVQPHTFTKNVEAVEVIPSQREIEVMEPRKVQREVEYTEVVPVKKILESIEPTIVKKEVEVIESRVVNKTIQVVESFPVKKMIEVVEMKHVSKEVETFEPRTLKKMIEVIEQVPVKKMVTVSEAVFHTEAVEFVEPVITIQTITKEILEPVVISQKTTQEIGAATLVYNQQQSKILKGEREYVGEERRSHGKEWQEDVHLRQKGQQERSKESYLSKDEKKRGGEDLSTKMQQKLGDIKNDFPTLGESSGTQRAEEQREGGNLKKDDFFREENRQKSGGMGEEKLQENKKGIGQKVTEWIDEKLSEGKNQINQKIGNLKEEKGAGNKNEGGQKSSGSKDEKLISGKKEQEGSGKSAPLGSKPLNI